MNALTSVEAMCVVVKRLFSFELTVTYLSQKRTRTRNLQLSTSTARDVCAQASTRSFRYVTVT